MTTDNEQVEETQQVEQKEEQPATVPVEEHRKLQRSLNQKYDLLKNQLEQAQGAREEAEQKVAELEGRLATLEAEAQDEGEMPSPTAVKALRREHAKALAELDKARRVGWQFAAANAATELALEHGLDKEQRDALLLSFGTVLSPSQLDQAVREARIRLKEEALEALAEKAKPTKPEVDSGKPTASRRGVLDELRSIDVTTPEGREKFLEKQEEFRQRVLAR